MKGYYFLLRSLSLWFRLGLCLSSWRRFSTFDDFSWFRGAFFSWFTTRRFNISLNQKAKVFALTYYKATESRRKVRKLLLNKASRPGKHKQKKETRQNKAKEP